MPTFKGRGASSTYRVASLSNNMQSTPPYASNYYYHHHNHYNTTTNNNINNCNGNNMLPKSSSRPSSVVAATAAAAIAPLAAAAAAITNNTNNNNNNNIAANRPNYTSIMMTTSSNTFVCSINSNGSCVKNNNCQNYPILGLNKNIPRQPSMPPKRLPCKNLADTSGLLQPHANSNKSMTWSTLIQVTAAFLIAGFGNVGAGLILDHVKEWPVFLHVDELFILVPSLLGLKGNLEMTMASRLSTQANLGHMDNNNKLLEMAKGNLALVQCQATVVSLSVAIFASVIKSMTMPSLTSETIDGTSDLINTMNGNIVGDSSSGFSSSTPLALTTNQDLIAANGVLIQRGQNDSLNDSPFMAVMANNHNNIGGPLVVERQVNGFDWDNALIVCASSLLTANIACFVLGTMMILVIVGSHKANIDPDNIASPVAASLGDMTTAALLAVIAHSIYQYSENQRMPYLALVIIILFVGMLPVWISVAKTNPYTSDVITKGWTPIVIAVFISSCGGFILEYGKSRFSRLPVFQPVINGVGGNLVAVQASRLSTSLHRNGKPGQLQSNFKLLSGPTEIFLSKKNDINFTTARLLLLISIPAHLLYFFVIRLIEGENAAPVTFIFLSFYMAMAVLQVALLLYLAQNLVNVLWRCSIDPDNYSTPILTATGDLLGCAFLLVVFVIAFQFNDPYAQTAV